MQTFIIIYLMLSMIVTFVLHCCIRAGSEAERWEKDDTDKD